MSVESINGDSVPLPASLFTKEANIHAQYFGYIYDTHIYIWTTFFKRDFRWKAKLDDLNVISNYISI